MAVSTQAVALLAAPQVASTLKQSILPAAVFNASIHVVHVQIQHLVLVV